MKTNNGHNGSERSVIGKPFRKVDARAKCTGQTRFADDIALPRMLFAKILTSTRCASKKSVLLATRLLQLPPSMKTPPLMRWI